MVEREKRNFSSQWNEEITRRRKRQRVSDVTGTAAGPRQAYRERDDTLRGCCAVKSEREIDRENIRASTRVFRLRPTA